MNGVISSISCVKRASASFLVKEFSGTSVSLVQKLAFNALSCLAITLQAVPLSFAVESLCILGLTFLFLYLLTNAKLDRIPYTPLERRYITPISIYSPRRDMFFEETRFSRRPYYVFHERPRVHVTTSIAPRPLLRLDRVGERRSYEC